MLKTDTTNTTGTSPDIPEYIRSHSNYARAHWLSARRGRDAASFEEGMTNKPDTAAELTRHQKGADT